MILLRQHGRGGSSPVASSSYNACYPEEIVRFLCQGKASLRPADASLLPLHQTESNMCLRKRTVDFLVIPGRFDNAPIVIVIIVIVIAIPLNCGPDAAFGAACPLLSSIAFQYYPLDMNMETNPFIVSWWPLALEDSALFHVSLQTASLDEELRAQRGFAVSEALMVDSVSKLRKKIEHSSSALQDETINAVVTLAAIEHGKGNLESSVMHIDGVKQMISLRGGIGQVKQTSALTARMVLWVSMLVSCRPQFHINEDVDGDGVLPSLQWQLASGNMDSHSPRPCDFDIDPRVGDVLARLRYIFHETDMTTTELHDLTCFAIHKLLSLEPPSCDGSKEDYPYLASESLRYALVLYLLIVHGTTYYSHIHLATFLAKQLKDHLHHLPVAGGSCDSFNIWAVSIGMASSFDQGDRRWFVSQANSARLSLDLNCWGDVLLHLETILWLKTSKADLVWSGWQGIFSKTDQ
ncbi:hypothetical protein ED733_003945 [Metarhizium rileyi]|uniref:Transcription factor domain-containing protein n=1 Tax=Metarhizium rileyi (strain RCEF 4871) TaxID=1649241 RepID=A0A5C6G4M9_METRR|nr:hypothetical protein ED733_003945 [Metarhizium rileyi]